MSYTRAAVLFLLLQICLTSLLYARPGDSLWVQTFSFDSIECRRARFQFPDHGDWDRILMYYTIKCDDRTPGDKYPCGEWDVTTFTRVFRDTGELDSVRHEQALFEIDGRSPELLAVRDTPVYEYYEYWQEPLSRRDTDRYLRFHTQDYIEIPASVLAGADSALSISCWVLGSPDQPQNDHLFEACAEGDRVLNVHLPWGTGEVYWEAGGRKQGNNNRLQRAAEAEYWKGRWNQWIFVKDCRAGEMRIYLNGELWHKAANMTRSIVDVDRFIFGANCNANGGWYSGSLDEIAIFDTALDSLQARAWFQRDTAVSSSLEDHLRARYDCDALVDGRLLDSLPNGIDATVVGQPQLRSYGLEGRADYKPGKNPQLCVDSLLVAPREIRFFEDWQHPVIQTRRQLFWLPGSALYDGNGRLLREFEFEASDTLHNEVHVWYDAPHKRIEPVELERYITPYGGGLDLGEDGYTMIRDVSAYAPLLRGLVDLEAHNGYELLDLRFCFLEGPAPRKLLACDRIWPGAEFRYRDLADNLELSTALLEILPSTEYAVIRSRISGHGHYGPHNCCEWAPKEHELLLNGRPWQSWIVWRNCGDNPIQPQGGTWQFDRAGWCPGSFVDTYDHVVPASALRDTLIAIDYSIEDYAESGGEEDGRYHIEHQFLQYGPCERSLDAALDEIIAPSSADEFRRYNPVSGNAIVRVANRGCETLKMLRIHYGLENGPTGEHFWRGELNEGDTLQLLLPALDWLAKPDSAPSFSACITEVNGRQDAAPWNNCLYSQPRPWLFLPDTIVVEMLSPDQGRAAENEWQLLDAAGQLLASRNSFVDAQTQRDTLLLAPGAYEFHCRDSEEDGMILHWWLRGYAPDQMGSNGRLRLLDAQDILLVDLGYDFAEGVGLRFFVR